MKHIFMGHNSTHSRIIINNNYDAYYLIIAFTCCDLIFICITAFTSHMGCIIISGLQVRKQRPHVKYFAQGHRDRQRSWGTNANRLQCLHP